MSGPSYNSPDELLGAAYARYGRSFLDNPRRCEGLLRDYFPRALPDIAALLLVLKRNIPQTMLVMPPKSIGEPAIAGFAKQVAEGSQISADAARWAVAVWATALGLAAEPVIPVVKPTPAKPATVQPRGGAVGLMDYVDPPAPRKEKVTKPPVGGGMRKFAVASAASGGVMAQLALTIMVMANDTDTKVGGAVVFGGLFLLCALGFAIAWGQLGKAPYAPENTFIVLRNSIAALALVSLAFCYFDVVGFNASRSSYSTRQPLRVLALFDICLFGLLAFLFLRLRLRSRTAAK
jgi:hypothetical protein